MRYKAILTDADDTLLDFQSAEKNAIRALLSRFGVSSPDAPEEYRRINAGCWSDYEKGLLTLDALRVVRFERFTERFAPFIDARRLADAYDEILIDSSRALPGAAEAVQQISAKLPIAVVTNGTGDMQRRRLERAGLMPYFACVVVSEEIGSRKPEPDMLLYALKLLNVSSPSDALMMGDSPTSDMPAAKRAGMDFLWFNPSGRKRPDGATIAYEARGISELIPLATQD